MHYSCWFQTPNPLPQAPNTPMSDVLGRTTPGGITEHIQGQLCRVENCCLIEELNKFPELKHRFAFDLAAKPNVLK